MFRYLNTVHDRVSHLVCWKFDRLFRNTDDTTDYRRQLRGLGIKEVSVTEPIDDSSPNGEFQRTIISAVDQLDNKNRALRSLVSMKATFRAGRWVWSAPIGYICVRKPLQCLQIDPVRGPLIARMFEMIATGQIKKATALAQLTRLGLRSLRGKALTQQTVNNLLTNELYCGRMYAKTWNQRMKGDFVPLISEELFGRAQAVLSGRAVTTVPHKRQNEDFPMKGTLRCNVCNAAVTGSKSAGKMAARFKKDDPARDQYVYRYYHCYKSTGHFNQRAEMVEGALEKLLIHIEPQPDRLNAVVGLFRAIWAERTAMANIEVNAMKSQLKKLLAKEARLLDSLSEGVITNAAYTITLSSE